MTSTDGISDCPECGEPLYADEEWLITDPTLIGTPVGESIDGDYAHARCVDRGLVAADGGSA